jgi:ClpP class serine protease
MSYPRIAARLFAEPWCCLPEVHSSLCAQFSAFMERGERMAGDDPVGPSWKSAWTGESGYYHPQVVKSNGMAYLPVTGILGKHLSTLDMQCGGFDVGFLAQQMRNVADDPEIQTLVLNFNTPGGVAIGIGQAAAAIRSVSESGKRVIGYTDYQCASAGYWLASACDEFHAESSAMVGSISTYCAGVDSSKHWEKMGLQLKLARTGTLKAMGHPGKEWTQEEVDYLQARCESIDADFKGFVRERRGIADESMNGGVWYAGKAPAGLVDSVAFSSVQSLIESIFHNQ